jgi:hypothetical protein
MKLKSLTRAAAAAGAALALSATVAMAQVPFQYYTTGFFANNGGLGTCSGAAATVATCSGAGLTLTFNGFDGSTVAPSYGSGSVVRLGSFEVTGNGAVTVPPPDITFTLLINQVMPNVATGQTVGSITGTITRPVGGPYDGSLLWQPSPEVVQIDPVLYDIIFRDLQGNMSSDGLVIAAAGSTTIEAYATVTPEPATVALLGTGIAGLGLFGLRRRNAQQA